MIKIKHFMDAVEPDDGQRIWVEPFKLTLDLQEWCKVNHLMSHLGPPKALRVWFDQHPYGYDYFRGKYHQVLSDGPYAQALEELAKAAMDENFTLLHSGDDREFNVAVAMHEYLSELQAYSG